MPEAARLGLITPDCSALGSSGESLLGWGQYPILASLSIVLRLCVPSQWLSVGDSNQKGPSDSGMIGMIEHFRPELWKLWV